MMTEKETSKIIQSLDFTQWSNLAQQDINSFESMRLAAIEEFIESAPERQQHRLRCLQWRIDQERRLSRSPMGACIRISRMMWESLMGEDGLVSHMQQLRASCEKGDYSTKPHSYQATVIPIRPKH